jgi:hypothetical protein
LERDGRKDGPGGGERMRSIRLRWGAVATAAGLLSVALVAGAGADTPPKQITTEVRFLEVNRETFREFTGQIAARLPCRDDRDVTLWYKPSAESSPQRLGTDETNRKGRFDIDLSSQAIAGLYAVSVRKEVEKEDDDKFVCKLARPVFVQF